MPQEDNKKSCKNIYTPLNFEDEFLKEIQSPKFGHKYQPCDFRLTVWSVGWVNGIVFGCVVLMVN